MRRAHVLSFMNNKKPKTGDGNVSATMGPKRKNPVVAETPVVLDHTLKKEDAKAFLMEKLELREHKEMVAEGQNVHRGDPEPFAPRSSF